MSSDERQLTRLPAPVTYDVGYGKPPAKSRFRPGQSGNPRGRPRGRKNKAPALHEERLKAIILDEAYRTIKVNDGEKQISVPMAQAIVRSMAVTAAKGNTRAQRLFAELLATTENSNKKLSDEWLETAITYKVEWEQEIERCRRLGLPEPLPLPHPDDIIINFRGNGPPVEIRGPMSREELADLRWWLERRDEYQLELRELQNCLSDPEYKNLQTQVQADVKHTLYILSIIERGIETRAGKPCLERLKAEKI